MIRLIFLLLLGLMTINCSDTTINYNEVELDKEFNIEVGDSAVITNEGLVIKFKSVEDDSRCPEDAVCVWEGNASAVLEMKNSLGDTLTSKLNTTLKPRMVEFSSLIIELKNLFPYPKLNETINTKDYIARLLVTNN